jgi:hypothetical protein
MVVLYATTLTAVLGLIVLRLVRAGASSSRREAVGGAAPAETAASGTAGQPAKPRIPPELLDRSSVTAPDEAATTDAPAPPIKPRIPPELLERSRARASTDR